MISKEFSDKRLTRENLCPDCGRTEHFVRIFEDGETLCITIPADDYPRPEDLPLLKIHGIEVITNEAGEREISRVN